jgi:hypothetical protein
MIKILLVQMMIKTNCHPTRAKTSSSTENENRTPPGDNAGFTPSPGETSKSQSESQTRWKNSNPKISVSKVSGTAKKLSLDPHFTLSMVISSHD